MEPPVSCRSGDIPPDHPSEEHLWEVLHAHFGRVSLVLDEGRHPFRSWDPEIEVREDSPRQRAEHGQNSCGRRGAIQVRWRGLGESRKEAYVAREGGDALRDEGVGPGAGIPCVL
jgi:hypothetical protein